MEKRDEVAVDGFFFATLSWFTPSVVRTISSRYVRLVTWKKRKLKLRRSVSKAAASMTRRRDGDPFR
jgi:hypothetical protein